MNVTVTVSGVNEAPSITDGPTSPRYAENGSADVATYTTESNGGSVSWTLEGTDASVFSISGSGALSFISPPDFEAPTDADTNNKYEVTVKAIENSESDTLNVTVTVTNVNEAPSITGGTASPSFAENSTSTVAVYTASDPEGATISWTLEGTDASVFRIKQLGRAELQDDAGLRVSDRRRYQ